MAGNERLLNISAEIDPRTRDRILELAVTWDVAFGEAVARVLAAGLEHILSCEALRAQQNRRGSL